jgi:hypothetical protein
MVPEAECCLSKVSGCKRTPNPASLTPQPIGHDRDAIGRACNVHTAIFSKQAVEEFPKELKEWRDDMIMEKCTMTSV